MWTLVVILSISANFSRWIEFEDKDEFTYTFQVIPIAMIVLFGVTLGIPIFIKIVVKLFGDKPSEIPVLSAIGMYAYSFSSFLITCTICGFVPY